MQTINGRIIRGESLEIDDKHFIDCTLVDCILEYSGGDVTFERTSIRGCRHIFYGRARCTLPYLQDVGLIPAPESEWAEISASVN